VVEPEVSAVHPFTFERVRGQSAAIARLRECGVRDRVPQALLFHGPLGVGKTTTAMAVAAAVNCEASDAAARPCGTCLACRKIAKFNHPDVNLVMPVYPAALWKEEAAKSEREQPESPLCRVYAEWADNPYHVFSWAKRPSIATEWVLEMRSEASLKTFEGRNKVIVISAVETMGVEAANRILKMLEEPGPNTLFILTTNRLHHVLPTIRSRCQRLTFSELDADVIAGVLTAEFDQDPTVAAQLASIGRGSLARAVRLADSGALETREWALRVVSRPPSGIIDHLADSVLADSRLWDRGRVRLVAEVLVTWYRDVLAARHGAADSELVNRDRVADIRLMARDLTVEDVAPCVRALEQLERDVEHQVTPALALFTTLRLLVTGEFSDAPVS
jgi:DNA polymerase-3 subunit delta'